MRGYYQSKVKPCVCYRRESVILTYVDYCVIFSHKKETIISLIQSLNNGTENYVLTVEGYISNYLRVNIKKYSDGTFKLSQSNLAEKIINHVGLEVYVSLKSREAPAGKP